ncbi:MAG TPA: hypothetical protein VFO85_18695, partial [Vicinamibacteria bacterium]|nr:hypothetical protein [Vicinamibacteria bacterium]
MSRARAVALAAAAALALAAGCGDDEGESSAARGAAEGYFSALATGDAARACGLLSDDVRKQFVARVAAITSAPNCERALEALLKGRGGELVRRVARSAKVQDVNLDGDTATVKISSAGQQADV